MRKLLSVILSVCLVVTMMPWNVFAATEIKNNQTDAPTDKPVIDNRVLLDEAHFPDSAFRGLIETKYDENKDGEIQKWESSSVREIYIADNSSISSLQGIEYFTNLNRLIVDNLNGLSSLNLSELQDLSYLKITNSGISNLDVSGCVNLEKIYCNNNRLGALNLSNQSKLYEVDCSNNSIRTLTLPYTDIANLNCKNNNLNSLKIPKIDKLNELDCSYNNLSSLSLNVENYSKYIKLSKLDCSNNNLIRLSFPKISSISNLDCHNNKLETLDVSNVSSIYGLNASNNHLLCIDDSNSNISSKNLDFSNNVRTVNSESVDLKKMLNNFDYLKFSNIKGGSLSTSGIFRFNNRSHTATYEYSIGYNKVTFTIEYLEDELNKLDVTFGNKCKLQDGIYYMEYDSKGTAITPKITNNRGDVLNNYSDFSVSVSPGYISGPGEYTVTIYGRGYYTGILTYKFKVIPKAPESLKATFCSSPKEYNDVYVEWSPVEKATGYILYYRNPVESTEWKVYKNTTETSVSIDKVTDGLRYEFKVEAYMVNNGITYNSTSSEVAEIRSLEPMKLLVKGYKNRFNLYWSGSDNRDGYQISMASNMDETNIIKEELNGDLSKCKIYNYGKSGYFKIRPFIIVKEGNIESTIYGPWSRTVYKKIK